MNHIKILIRNIFTVKINIITGTINYYLRMQFPYIVISFQYDFTIKND